MSNKLTNTALTYWTDGNTQVDIRPGDPSPYGTPFVIRAGGAAFNVVIFAANEEDAVKRLRAAVQEHLEKDYKYKSAGENEDEDDYFWSIGSREKAQAVIACIDAGRYHIEPLDRTLVLKVPWASNDRVLG